MALHSYVIYEYNYLSTGWSLPAHFKWQAEYFCSLLQYDRDVEDFLRRTTGSSRSREHRDRSRERDRDREREREREMRERERHHHSSSSRSRSERESRR